MSVVTQLTHAALPVGRGTVRDEQAEHAIELLHRVVVSPVVQRGVQSRVMAARSLLEHYRWQETQDPVALLVEVLGSKEEAYAWMERKLQERDALLLEAKSDE